MAWIRLDDHFDENPKILAAGPASAWIWLRCLAYCNRNLTDGFVPEIIAHERCASADPIDAAARLESAGLWKRVDGGYQIHDYLDYQGSKAQILEARAATRKRVQAFRRRRNAVTNADGNDVCTPSPTPKKKEGASESLSSSSRSGPSTHMGDTGTASRSRFVPPSLREVEAYCSERRNGVDPQAWLDHYESNGWRVGRNPMKDWKAAVRTWERQRGFGPQGAQAPLPPRPKGPDPALEKARKQREEWEREQRESQEEA